MKYINSKPSSFWRFEMYPVRKLKPDRSIGGLIPVLGMLAIFGLSTLIFDITVGFFILSVMIWIYALYTLFVFVRMGNFGHLILCGYCLFLGVMALLASQYIESGWDPDIKFRVAWNLISEIGRAHV